MGKVRADQFRSIQVRALHVCIFQIRSGKNGLPKVGISQITEGQNSVFEIAVAKVATVQIAAAQLGLFQVNSLKKRATRIHANQRNMVVVEILQKLPTGLRFRLVPALC